MASVISYLVFLLTLMLGTVTGIRYRSSIRYTRYYTYYYYSGYRYTYYYYYSGSSYNTGIAGVVVGCVIAVGGVIACIVSFCILCRRMRRTRTTGRLVTPAVYTANTTTVPGTVVMHGSTATLGTQPQFDATYPPDNSGFPVAATNTTGSDGNTEQKHGAMPPPYEAVVGGVTSTVTSSSGTNADVSSEPNTNTAM